MTRRARLPCVVKDNPQRESRALMDPRDAVTHLDAVVAARAADRADARGEHREPALLGGDDIAHRLRARPLFDEQELAALMVDAGFREKHHGLRQFN